MDLQVRNAGDDLEETFSDAHVIDVASKLRIGSCKRGFFRPGWPIDHSSIAVDADEFARMNPETDPWRYQPHLPADEGIDTCRVAGRAHAAQLGHQRPPGLLRDTAGLVFFSCRQAVLRDGLCHRG